MPLAFLELQPIYLSFCIDNGFDITYNINSVKSQERVDSVDDLNKYEIKMLRILNNELPDAGWGSWWTPCLEFLCGRGLCKNIDSFYIITDKGRKLLSQL